MKKRNRSTRMANETMVQLKDRFKKEENNLPDEYKRSPREATDEFGFDKKPMRSAVEIAKEKVANMAKISKHCFSRTELTDREVKATSDLINKYGRELVSISKTGKIANIGRKMARLDKLSNDALVVGSEISNHARNLIVAIESEKKTEDKALVAANKIVRVAERLIKDNENTSSETYTKLASQLDRIANEIDYDSLYNFDDDDVGAMTIEPKKTYKKDEFAVLVKQMIKWYNDGKIDDKNKYWEIKGRNQRSIISTVAHEAAKQVVFSKDFKYWDLTDNRGGSVAHVAAANGNLPKGFDRWGIKIGANWTVAHMATKVNKLPKDLPSDWDFWDIPYDSSKTIRDEYNRKNF